MHINDIKNDFSKQLKNGFNPRKFETFILKYLKTLESNDAEVVKTLYYYDMTNGMVRTYIRTKSDTHNIHFPMNNPSDITVTNFELSQ